MVNSESHDTAVEQIARIRQAFERTENAGETHHIDEHCTEDIVAIPPGEPPTVGKDAAKQALEALFASFEIEVEYTSEEVVVGEELAFDRLTATETLTPKEGGQQQAYSADALWVYRRSPDGEWKQSHAIWNYRD